MKILWLTWKDRSHPLAGGAEIVNENLAKRLVADGHKVTFVVAGYMQTGRGQSRATRQVIKDGYRIIRVGTRWSVYWQAYKYYRKHLVGWADLVIDEVNTIPFFARFYVKEKNICFFHQLCNKIWFYQMCFPLSLVGFILEPVYLWLIRNREVITISQSTKDDLVQYGFKKDKIHIIPLGIEMKPVGDLSAIDKYPELTILSLGAIRSMKRTAHIVKAFNKARKEIRTLKLIIAGGGSGRYARKVFKLIEKSPYRDSISYLGAVNGEKKREIMGKSHLICVTSVKEGWGLIVTEANSQGTPAIVYNVDGLRDSVNNDITGLISYRKTHRWLARSVVEILRDKSKYERLRKQAWEDACMRNLDRTYQAFLSYIDKQ